MRLLSIIAVIALAIGGFTLDPEQPVIINRIVCDKAGSCVVIGG